ncbi:hypothetical protein DSO57_1017244 [Entomophthora muscae]|uniref:Uncharacterized protein n=1 Tax=Entomophthora muscae TaxID=34485 RepID=A0ACC2TFL1_9FUNG|nr:hypothetical protein DSO57_1017244 [Entomophthora muscae]
MPAAQALQGDGCGILLRAVQGHLDAAELGPKLAPVGVLACWMALAGYAFSVGDAWALDRPLHLLNLPRRSLPISFWALLSIPGPQRRSPESGPYPDSSLPPNLKHGLQFPQGILTRVMCRRGDRLTKSSSHPGGTIHQVVMQGMAGMAL